MQWIKSEDELPDIGVPVWAVVGKKIILLCRVYADPVEDRNWLWSRAYDPYMYMINDDTVWDCDADIDDDCIVTHWQYLPEFPQEVEDQKEDQWEWWGNKLKEFEQEGRDDADKGVYNLPYPVDDNDPSNDDINHAYAKGFHARRNELGPEKFKWSD